MKPLKFNALLKTTLWGGDKIIPFKHLDEHLDNVGESWEYLESRIMRLS